MNIKKQDQCYLHYADFCSNLGERSNYHYPKMRVGSGEKRKSFARVFLVRLTFALFRVDIFLIFRVFG